jgi:hypothetical protein
MMSLKTVGMLTFEACETCENKISCDNPSLYKESDTDSVGCADYLSTDESEE